MDFVCTICGKNLKTKQALSGHQRIHSSKKTLEEHYAQRITEYTLHPKLCELCGTPLPYEKRKYQRYCNQSCRARATNRARGSQKFLRICKNCKQEFLVTFNTSEQECCSSKCSAVFRSNQKLESWLTTGKMEGWTGGAHGGAPRHSYAERYILQRQNECCEMCKQPFIWYSKPLPMIMDHIDGDSTNNHPDNLRLLCPNCEATTPTWKGRNRGSGRASKGFLPPYVRVKKNLGN